MYNSCDILDKKTELKKQYKMLFVREFRITKRIENLTQKNKEMTVETITIIFFRNVIAFFITSFFRLEILSSIVILFVWQEKLWEHSEGMFFFG